MREVTLIGEVHKLQWYLLDGVTIHEYRRTEIGPDRDKLIVEKRYTEHPFGSLTPEQLATGSGIEPPSDPRGQWWLNGVIGYTEPWVKVDTPSNNLEAGDVVDTGKVFWVCGANGRLAKYAPDEVTVTRTGGKISDVQPKVSR